MHRCIESVVLEWACSVKFTLLFSISDRCLNTLAQLFFFWKVIRQIGSIPIRVRNNFRFFSSSAINLKTGVYSESNLSAEVINNLILSNFHKQ